MVSHRYINPNDLSELEQSHVKYWMGTMSGFPLMTEENIAELKDKGFTFMIEEHIANVIIKGVKKSPRSIFLHCNCKEKTSTALIWTYY